MADHADHEGQNIYPSTDLIAWKTGYSFRQVQRMIDALIADGILTVVKPARQQKPATYAMDFKAGTVKPPFDRVARKQGRQNGAPEGRQNGTPNQSRDDILAQPGMTFQPSRDDIAMSSDPIEPIMNHGSDSSARAILRDCGLYNGSIRKVLALGIDEPTLIASVQNLASAGWGAGAIFNELIDNPPKEGIPYAKPEQRPIQPDVSPHQSRRAAKGSHNGTGGDALKNPGWMDQAIADAERRAREGL
jgi:hypothetical protein